jgi:hypothetical protein
LVIVDSCPCGFASDFECLSLICLAESWMSKLTHTEACFTLQVRCEFSRHEFTAVVSA